MYVKEEYYDDDDDDREGVVLNTQREKMKIKNTFHAMCNNVKA